MHADLDALENGAASSHDGPVVNRHMTCHLHGVGNDDVVSDDAIMGNVYIGHEETVFADFCDFLVDSTSVYSHAFPYGRVVADHYGGLLPLKFKILRNGRNHCPRKYLAVATDPGTGVNGDVGTDPTSFTNFHIFMYGSKCFHGDVFPDPGVAVYF